ncbi:hypothetical protein EW146_g1186 [Bondarzewia mesenterica]|uniref:Ras-GEF domain-containing protein n=1 Tax=Bondarzewia mesenterica TaxID=1095465 RepID=A0A4S4M4N5_9AGAM|nr:hypothetical protein EW146_g1186 [Bondarzewia mesenterica]
MSTPNTSSPESGAHRPRPRLPNYSRLSSHPKSSNESFTMQVRSSTDVHFYRIAVPNKPLRLPRNPSSRRESAELSSAHRRASKPLSIGRSSPPPKVPIKSERESDVVTPRRRPSKVSSPDEIQAKINRRKGIVDGASLFAIDEPFLVAQTKNGDLRDAISDFLLQASYISTACNEERDFAQLGVLTSSLHNLLERLNSAFIPDNVRAASRYTLAWESASLAESVLQNHSAKNASGIVQIKEHFMGAALDLGWSLSCVRTLLEAANLDLTRQWSWSRILTMLASDHDKEKAAHVREIRDSKHHHVTATSFGEGDEGNAITAAQTKVNSSQHNIYSSENVFLLPKFLEITSPPPTGNAADIVMTEDGTCIKGASIQAMIYLLTCSIRNAGARVDLMDRFFLTFRLYSSAVELFDGLVTRFNEFKVQEGTQEVGEEAQRVKLRVINVFYQWVKTYWRDEDSPVLGQMHDFASGSSESMSALLPVVDKRLKQQDCDPRIIRRLREVAVMVRKGPEHIERPKLAIPLLRWHSHEGDESGKLSLKPLDSQYVLRSLEIKSLAKSFLTNSRCGHPPFTVLSYQRTSSIMLAIKQFPANVLRSNGCCPSHGIMMHFFCWVVRSIIGDPDPRPIESRVKIRGLWIQVAKHCQLIRNYDSMYAIANALRSEAIARLWQTHDHLSYKLRTAEKEIKQITDAWAQFRPIKDRLTIMQTTVPPLALYRKNLVRFLDCNGRTIRLRPDSEKKVPHIHVYDCIAQSIREMEQWHQPYDFKKSQPIQEWIRSSLDHFCVENMNEFVKSAAAISVSIEGPEPANTFRRRFRRTSSIGEAGHHVAKFAFRTVSRTVRPAPDSSLLSNPRRMPRITRTNTS